MKINISYLLLINIFFSVLLCSINSISIDIFDKENSKYLNYLKKNLISQINKNSQFYSIIDCLDSYANVDNSGTKNKTNLSNLCLVEDKEGKSLPFYYKSSIFNNTNHKSESESEYSRTQINHKVINMDDYLIDESEKLKRLNKIKDFLCHVESECKNLEIYTKNNSHFCYFYEYEITEVKKNKKFYFFRCELINVITQEKYKVLLSWGEKTAMRNFNLEKNSEELSVYIKGEFSYRRYDSKKSGIFEKNEKVNTQAKKIREFVKENFSTFPSKEFRRKYFSLFDEENTNSLFYYIMLAMVLIMVAGTAIYLIFKFCRKRRINDELLLSEIE